MKLSAEENLLIIYIYWTNSLFEAGLLLHAFFCVISFGFLLPVDYWHVTFFSTFFLVSLLPLRIRIQHFKWIRIWFRIQRFDDQKLKKKKIQLKKVIFFWSKIEIYLFLGILKRRSRYRRSLQPSKKKIWNFLTFFLLLFLCAFFTLLDPDPI